MGMDLPDFLNRFSTLTFEINELLGMRFYPGNVNYDSEMGNVLKGILILNESGDLQNRDYELSRLELFVKHLTYIKSYSKDLFHRFKKDIHKSRNKENFYGIRFEVNIASSLAQQRISFTKIESPGL